MYKYIHAKLQTVKEASIHETILFWPWLYGKTFDK